MVVRIGGKQMYLWRAVDAEGEVLDVLLQAKRDTKAARKLMRKLLKRQGMVPDEWVTDKNLAYGAALRELKLTKAPHTRRKGSVTGTERRCRMVEVRSRSRRSSRKVPSLHRLDLEGPERAAGDEVALKIERVVDRSMDREKALG